MIHVEFKSADRESAERDLNEYARPACNGLTTQRVMIEPVREGTLEHQHDWHPTGVWDSGHNPPRQRYDCAECDESEWMNNDERDALERRLELPRNDDIIDYRQKVEDAIKVEGSAMHGGAWAREYAQGVAPIAWALVGLAEELNAGTTEIAEAIENVSSSLDSLGVGSDIERGLDGMGRDIAEAIETGLSKIAREIGGIGS